MAYVLRPTDCVSLSPRSKCYIVCPRPSEAWSCIGDAGWCVQVSLTHRRGANGPRVHRRRSLLQKETGSERGSPVVNYSSLLRRHVAVGCIWRGGPSSKSIEPGLTNSLRLLGAFSAGALSLIECTCCVAWARALARMAMLWKTRVGAVESHRLR